MIRLVSTFVLAILSLVPLAYSQTIVERLEEDDWMKRMTVDDRLTMHGTDVMGDAIDPHFGGLVFTHTDVSLPGNSSLPVEITRRRATGLGHRTSDIEFADWELVVPKVTVRTLEAFGWSGSRCSNSFAQSFPVQQYHGANREPSEYSNGITASVPGYPSQKLLEHPTTGAQWPSSAKYVTSGNWYFTCGTADDGGESFVAHLPDGTVAEFDVFVSRPVALTSNFSDEEPKTEETLFASRVTDVHGNWVDYDYTFDGRLTRIHANDGREITLLYTGNRIRSVTANGRTWDYVYRSPTYVYPAWSTRSGQTATGHVLGSVTRPDGRAWTFSLDHMLSMPKPANGCASQSFSVSLVHPDGLTGTFNLVDHAHRMKGSGSILRPSQCPLGQPELFANSKDSYNWMLSVTQKTLSGTNMPSETWTFEYEGDQGAPFPQDYQEDTTGEKDADTNWTRVTGPTEHKTYYHRWSSISYGGKLIATEIRESASGPVLQTVHNSYIQEAKIGNLFPSKMGDSGGDSLPDRNTLVTVTQETDVYHTRFTYETDQTSADYAYGKPKKVDKWSNLTSPDASSFGTRTSDYTYEHKPTPWVLGQTNTEHRNGILFYDYDYDTLGRLTEYKRFGSVWMEFSYHSNDPQKGLPKWVRDANGTQTDFDTFKAGRPQSVTFVDSSTISRIIDDNGWLTSQTNLEGNTTTYEYNPIGWLARVVPPKHNGAADDQVITYQHTLDGVTQTVVQGNRRSVINYDGRLRPYLAYQEDTGLTNIHSYTRKEFDSQGRETFVSIPADTAAAIAGVQTEYDSLGRIKKSEQTVSPFAVTAYNYLPNNRRQVTDPRGNTTTMSNSGFGDAQDGDEVFIDVPLGADTKRNYDIYGNLTTLTIGSSIEASTYNARQLLEAVTDPDGYTSSRFYDGKDRVVVSIDGARRKTRTVYDLLDRPTKIIKAWRGNNSGGASTLDCATMRASYDTATGYLQQCYQLNTYTPSGLIDTVTDANGNTTKYTYDALDRQSHTYFPSKTSAGSWSSTDYEQITYDGLGHVTTKRTRSGQLISYTYDALGRLVDRNVPGAPIHSSNGRAVTHSFTRDAAGRPLTATHDGETLVYDYDDIGRVLSQTYGGSLTVGYEYDDASNLIELTYPDGAQVAYGYDARNRVTCAEDGAADPTNPCLSLGRRLATISYDDLSRRKQVTFANGSGTNFDYSDNGFLTCHDLNFVGAMPAECADSGSEVSYTFAHNGVGQLLSNYVSDDSFVWRANVGASISYLTNGLNQYTNVGGFPKSHDNNGNLAIDHRGHSYTYDAENVLRNVSGLPSGTATYRYRADGSRRSKTNSGSTSTFYYMGGQGYLDDDDTEFAADQEIAEYQAGSLSRRYYRLPGTVDEAFLMVDFDIDSGCTNSNYTNCERWIHHDRLGSTVALTDTQGFRVSTFTYSPFGRSGLEGDAGATFRFTGQKLDLETGLYYYKARYYDSDVGRFLQADPIGYEDQINLYGYVHNDPVNFADPSGTQSMVVPKKASTAQQQAANEKQYGIHRIRTIVWNAPWASEALTFATAVSHPSPETVSAAAFGLIGIRTRGGAWRDVKGIPGNEAHHMPAKSVSPLTKYEGPAISMLRIHHQDTASWGPSRRAVAHRARQKELINEGRFYDAQKMDIDDVQNQFGDLYDDALYDMWLYTRWLEDNSERFNRFTRAQKFRTLD